MAKITISTDEYNAMQTSLDIANKDIALLDSLVSDYRGLVNLYKEAVDELVNTGLYERVFSFDKLVNKLNLNKLEEIKEILKQKR